jgi:S1 RNA binding domain protein
MVLEVGSVVEGKVTGITKFGAFVELPGKKTGMVHISEVAATYVKEIRDFLTENQTVKVKVLAITPEGKINLSIKRAAPPPPARGSHCAASAFGSGRGHRFWKTAARCAVF